MLKIIIFFMIGTAVGVVGCVLTIYYFNFYVVDWGATGTWGLLIVTVIALTVAYQQLMESRRLHRAELTYAYISEIRKIISEGILNNAQKHVKQHINSSPTVPYNKDMQTVIYFYEELGIMYKENSIERQLILPLLGNLPLVYKQFKQFIENCRKSTGDNDQFQYWEYLKDQVKAKENTSQV